jgi:hypothetical protein
MEDEAASTAETKDAVVCIECGMECPPKARGWRAYRLDTDLLIYCPGCASREFDDAE